MINIRFTGVNEIINGLKGTAQEASRPEMMLDMAARDTQAKMSQEAPRGLTGLLSSEIMGLSPNQFTRIIEPTAKNVRPGNRYSLPIETGWGAGGKMPNVESVAAYYGATGNKKLAFAIAAGIASKNYAPNPFVMRTYEWVWGQINNLVEPFMAKMQARYIAG